METEENKSEQSSYASPFAKASGDKKASEDKKELQAHPIPERYGARKAALWSKLINFGLEFAVYIALPLIVFIYLGKWADGKLHTKFLVIIGIFLALGLSSYLIYKKIKEIKDILTNDKNDKN